MNSIGFDYFRRFENFPELDLGEINLLVGGNNSGKSTLVKALLLCVDNLRIISVNNSNKQINKPQFRFDANEWHDVKIKTFSRAIYNKPLSDSLGNAEAYPSSIVFKFSIEGFRFEIVVEGNKDTDSITGDISCFSIEDRTNMVKYKVDYVTHSMDYIALGETSEEETLIKKLYIDYKNATAKLEQLSDAFADIAEISAQNEKVESLKQKISELLGVSEETDDDFDYEKALQDAFKENSKSQYKEYIYSLPFEDYTDAVDENLFVHAIGNFIRIANNPGTEPPQNVDEPSEYLALMQDWQRIKDTRKFLRQEVDRIERSRKALAELLSRIRVEYISAHAANQNTIYNTADKNDYIAQTVHEFHRNRIYPGESEDLFIRDWMKRFDIGESYTIDTMAGEAYRVHVKEFDGASVNLADKGMGSIQMMILLFRLATIVRKYNLANAEIVKDLVYRNELKPLILIEEPEQNLHPKMQSLLADLFFEMNNKYGCRFIVETHSEYLIRKTQVIVAEMDYKDEEEMMANNPFKVYFFEMDAIDGVRNMQYFISGAFKDKFGEGFFDEAAKSDMTIIKKEFELKKKFK